MKNLHFLKSIVLISSITFLAFSCQKTDIPVEVNEDYTSHGLKGASAMGYSLYFDGVDDFVQVADNSSLNLMDQFTIAAWINIEEYVEWASIVTKGENANNFTIHQSGPGGGSEFGHLRFTADIDDLPLFLESETQIPLGEWHFVAVTWNGETLSFYLDGNLDGSGNLEGTLVTNDEPLFIGCDFPGSPEFWNGNIDEVRIWNEALSPTHIKASMQGKASPLGRALVGYWNLNEGKGTVARDRSKHKNNGSLSGDPDWMNP